MEKREEVTCTTTPTIAEKELFSEFLQHRYVTRFDEVTGEASKHGAGHDYLTGVGEYGRSDGILDPWVSGLCETQTPSVEIDCMLVDLVHVVRELRFVRDAFAHLRRVRKVLEEEAGETLCSAISSVAGSPRSVRDDCSADRYAGLEGWV